MNFWERLRRWLQGEPRPSTATAARDAGPAPTSNGGDGPVVTTPSTGKPVKPPTDKDILTHFSKRDLHITTMFNSISLSSDMKTLYLIDNGRAIAYDLTNPNGVVVGLLGDQLVAATGTTAVVDDEETRRARVPDGFEAEQTFKLTRNSQFTIVYNPGNEVLAIMGANDIIISIEEPTSPPVITGYNLNTQKLVRLRVTDDGLKVASKITTNV